MSELSERGAPMAQAYGEFARYFLVSGFGFGVDVASLAALVEIGGLPLLAANAISFTLGMVAVYLGSIWWVFGVRRQESARAEFVIFCSVGLLVLAVNQVALYAVAELLAVHYPIAKIAAAGASFTANFAVRKLLLF